MESIKHKMDCLLKEKDDAARRSEEAGKLGVEFESEANRLILPPF